MKTATLYLVLDIINLNKQTNKQTNKTPSRVRPTASVYPLMIQFLSKEGQTHKWNGGGTEKLATVGGTIMQG